MKRALLLTAAVPALLVAGWWALPSPIDAVAYDPPAAPAMTGVLAPNQALSAATLAGVGAFDGPETADADSQGRLYGGSRDGRITRVWPDGHSDVFANTQGRPLGMKFDAAGNLIVCDSYKGLLSIAPGGQIKVLATAADGIPLHFADGLDVGRDGWIYFTDASLKFGQTTFILDMLESRPWGRLLRHHPATGRTETLMTDLYFANGVALSKKGDFVVVNETYRYRITRYWLSGPRKGQSDVFADNLPGFPDGIAQSGRGTFWVAMPTTRNADADFMHPRPWLKSLVAKLPESLRPKPARYGLVVEMDENGKILRSLQDPAGNPLYMISAAQERKGTLYLGTLEGDAIGVLRL